MTIVSAAFGGCFCLIKAKTNHNVDVDWLCIHFFVLLEARLTFPSHRNRTGWNVMMEDIFLKFSVPFLTSYSFNNNRESERNLFMARRGVEEPKNSLCGLLLLLIFLLYNIFLIFSCVSFLTNWLWKSQISSEIKGSYKNNKTENIICDLWYSNIFDDLELERLKRNKIVWLID